MPFEYDIRQLSLYSTISPEWDEEHTIDRYT